MMNVGEVGYVDVCVKIVGIIKRIVEVINIIFVFVDEFEVFGKLFVLVVVFMVKFFNVYDIVDVMFVKGWYFNLFQNLLVIYVVVILLIIKVWEKFMSDLEVVVEVEREKERVWLVEGKGVKGKVVGDLVVLYGVVGLFFNKSVVVDLVMGFFDLLYKV